MTIRRATLIPLLSLTLAVALAAPAGASPGHLRFAGCQSSAAAPPVAGCTQLEELEAPGSLTFSVDGRSAYVGVPGRLLALDRDAAGGALSLSQCLASVADPRCTQVTGLIRTVTDIAVTRDGTSVYTASNANRLLGFTRNTNDGRLTWNFCLYSNYGNQGDLPGCPVGNFQETRQLEVSRDGRAVYLRDYGCADNTGDCFASVASYLRDPHTTGVTPRDGTDPATTGDGPFAVSPRGGTLYELDSDSGAISIFSPLGAARLRFSQCLAPIKAQICERPARMGRASQLAVSPDGGLLITALRSGRLRLFKRSRNGKLDFRACLSPAGRGRGCRSLGRMRGLDTAKVEQLRFSPDGRSLYAVADEAGGTLLRFTFQRKRGRLRLAQCLTSSPHRGCTQVPQLAGLSHIALTGRWVYAVAAGGGGTLVRFRTKKG